MSGLRHYTITGAHTGQTYLVVADYGRMRFFPPGSFTLPWTGESGHQYGLAWHPGAGVDLAGPPWIAARRAAWIVARREWTARRADARIARASRYTARKGSP